MHLRYVPLADGLLFVLDAKESLLDEERELLLEIKEEHAAKYASSFCQQQYGHVFIIAND